MAAGAWRCFGAQEQGRAKTATSRQQQCGRQLRRLSRGLLLMIALLSFTSLANAQTTASASQQQQQQQQQKQQPTATSSSGTGGAAAEAPGVSAADGLPPLIPLPLLLGTSRYRNPQLSPDGRFLAYVRPSKSGADDSVYNVFLKRLPDADTTGAAAAAAGRGRLGGAFNQTSLFDDEGVAKDRQVTFDPSRGVTSYSWLEDSSGILYIQDEGGDENYHLYLVPLKELLATPSNATFKATDLTPFPGVKADGIVGNKDRPDKLYIGLNRRDPSTFDLYALNLTTRQLALEFVNPGDVTDWHFNYDFTIKVAEGYNNSDGASYVLVRDDDPAATAAAAAAARKASTGSSSPLPLERLFKEAAAKKWTTDDWIRASTSGANVSTWRRLISWPFTEEGGVMRMNKAGDGLYVVSSLGRDTTEAQLIGLTPGAPVKQRLAANPLVNVGSVIFDPDDWTPQLAAFNYHKTEWQVLDTRIEADWRRLGTFLPTASATVVDRSRDKKTWVVAYSFDSRPTAFYLYREGQWPPRLLFEVQPDLGKYTMAKMHNVVITARDGLKLPAFLTLPVKKGVPATLPQCVTGDVPHIGGAAAEAPAPGAAAGSGKEAQQQQQTCPLDLKLPLVLSVHGGPWSRDSWGVDTQTQLLANRGYAVLQVNYRGSTGYGKAFLNAGNREWGIGSMQHDLTDAVNWAVKKGLVDPKKVCIMGGSYGGYATLAGLAFTPELYACGVDLVGISNVATFMKSIPAYWQPMQYEWLTRVGNAVTNSTLNTAISPVFHADKIRAPLLIGQGANDPRVPQPESDQMYTAMTRRGLPVTYLLYPDEGHGLARSDNRLDFYSRTEQFLAKYLGGRAGPVLKPKTTTVKLMSAAAIAQEAAEKKTAAGASKPAATAAEAAGASKPAQQQEPQKQQQQQQPPQAQPPKQAAAAKKNA